MGGGARHGTLIQVQREAWTVFPPQSQRQMGKRSGTFITKNLLRKQNQCCKWDRKERGVSHPPSHWPSSRGEDLKGEAGTLYPKEPVF